MPRLDFQGPSSTGESIFTTTVDICYPLLERSAPFPESAHLDRPTDQHRTDRLTLLLAIFTALGGLTCAMYFFNGANAGWTILSPLRESFYGRPNEPGTVNAQSANKNIDPHFAAQQSSRSSANAPGLSSTAVSSRSGTPGVVSSGQGAAGNPGSAGVPSKGGGVAGERSKGSGVASKVTRSVHSTNHRTLSANRKPVTRTNRQAANIAKKTSDITTKIAAQPANQNSRPVPSQAAPSIRNGSSQSSAGLRSGSGGGMRRGLSGAAGGALGGHN